MLQEVKFINQNILRNMNQLRMSQEGLGKAPPLQEELKQ